MAILNDILTKTLLLQVSDPTQKISDKIKVYITCICGAKKEISTRALKRKWSGKSEYLCKSCHVKTYANDDVRIAKFKKSFAKISNTAEHREKCSKAGKKPWQNPKTRTKIIEAVRHDNKVNPAKKRARQIALAALREKPWFKDHMTKMRTLATEACGISLKNNPELWTQLSKNFKLDDTDVKERHRQATSIATKLLLYKFLDDLGVDYIEGGDGTRVGYYVFDCLIKNIGSKNILVECQGDYWHSLAKSQSNDRAKFTYIDRYFPEYEIMYIWEYEFHTKDCVLQRLQSKLGIELASADFKFSDISITDVSTTDVKSFLDAYHYIGKGRGGKCFGAYLDGKLIACIVFSPPLRQNISEQFGGQPLVELSRLCIHPSYHKKNFASWFISRAISKIKSELIIAYADTTVGHTGIIYRAANFKLHHEVAPDYWYVDGDGFVMHKRTLYGKARRIRMTESEYAAQYGYFKKWGGRKLCFYFRKAE